MTHSDEISVPDDSVKPAFTHPTFKSEIIPLVLIILFVLVLMWPFVFGGKALMPDTWQSIHPWARGIDLHDNQTSIYDTVLEYGPWFEYSQQCLKEGRIPHWNPWQFCGTPLYANRLIPFFYPPFILAELIAAPHKVIGWFQLFNLILSGWGMFFLLRRWRMARSVSTIGSILWLTCGVHFLPFPLWTLGTAGFPWLIWALEGFLERPGIKPVAIAGLIAGLILMVGYPVLVVHMTYFTVLYFLARWWMRRRKGPGRIRWFVPPLILIAVYLIGVGISAIVNYPAYEYSRETGRQIAGFRDQAFEFEKRILITPPEEAGMDPVAARFGERVDTLLPINGRGTQRAWQYGGVLLYLLAFVGIFAGRSRAKLLAVIGLIFAIPVWIPEVYIYLLDILPGWAITILLPIEVLNTIICLLAVCGIEALTYKDWKPILSAKIIIPLLAAAAIVMTFLLFRNAPVINLPILFEVAMPDLLSRSPFHVFYLIAFGLLAIILSVLVILGRKPFELRWGFMLATIIFSTVVFWYLQPVYSEADYTPETPFISEWVGDAASTENSTTGNRVARLWPEMPIPFNPSKRTKSPFTPNLHLIYGLQDVGGYDSLVPRRYLEYCNELFGEDAFIDYRALVAFRAPSIINSRWFRAMGVRWVISQGELPYELRMGCTLAWDDRRDGVREGTDNSNDFIQVWEIYNPQPRAFLTRKVAYASDPNDSALVQTVNWAAQNIELVVVEDPSGENRTGAFPVDIGPTYGLTLQGSRVSFEIDDPEHIVLDIYAPEECYLILRDLWYPEWTATINGQETTIFPADYAFRAIRIPEGNHKVEFTYVPESFQIGSLVTLGTIVLVIVLYILPWILSGRKTLYMRPTAWKRYPSSMR